MKVFVFFIYIESSLPSDSDKNEEKVSYFLVLSLSVCRMILRFILFFILWRKQKLFNRDSIYWSFCARYFSSNANT